MATDRATVLAKLRALVLLSGLETLEEHVIGNAYNSSREDPWLILVCPKGTLKIGWRKRVIGATWTFGDAEPITEDDLQWITHGPDHFHAYGYEQALTFLSRVVKNAVSEQEVEVRDGE